MANPATEWLRRLYKKVQELVTHRAEPLPSAPPDAGAAPPESAAPDPAAEFGPSGDVMGRDVIHIDPPDDDDDLRHRRG